VTYHQGKLSGVVHGDVQELGSVEGGEAEGQGAQGRLLLVQTHDLQPGVCVGAYARVRGSVGRCAYVRACVCGCEWVRASVFVGGGMVHHRGM
jgi:hypothetical protein